MRILFSSIFILLLIALPINVVWAQDPTSSVDTTNAGLDVTVAPGELFPISVKLVNFGGGKRVDVTVIYLITSESGEEIYKASETIAVETTNSFVKTIQIPFDTKPGVYTAETSLLYQGQEAPAVTTFSFRVERKILGLFQDEFILYGVGILLISILMVIIGYNLVKRRGSSRLGPTDYSNIPTNERVFYELISDTVLSMRQKVGDRALDIASGIEGLKIDKETGRIIKLTRTPSKIIAELVSGYEKTLGKKVNFFFRKQSTKL